jgi:hypothetical protein
VQTIVKVRWHLLLAGAWLAAMAGAALAQSSDAGKFLSVTGDVRVISRDGAPRAAQREAEFREGESIITGVGALAQLRMFDGALMSVRGDTEIKLERFSYAGEQDRNASFLMSVLKGGLRTITGVIGRQNRERYRISTATVTLGVRGTDFEIVHVPPQAASREVPAGTYNRVFEGVTSMQNRAGVMLLVSRDQTAFAALQGNVAPILVPPPAAIFGRPTPLPTITPQTLRQDGADKAPTAARPAPGATPIDTPRALSPTLVTPIDAPRTLSPTLVTPIEAPRAVSPTLTPIQTAPVLTSPILTPIEAAPTTTLTPIQTAPVLTSPTLTPIQTAPVLTSPAATPIQTAPALTSPVLAPATPVLAPVAPVLAPAPPKPVAPIVPIIGR